MPDWLTDSRCWVAFMLGAAVGSWLHVFVMAWVWVYRLPTRRGAQPPPIVMQSLDKYAKEQVDRSDQRR